MSVYYVDSVSGNDGSAGTSFDAPFKTLSAVVSVAATSDNIFLKAGSEWREALDVGALNNLTISYYGDIEADGLPVIRGDDTLSSGGWDDSTDRADANTNVYSRDFTITGGNDNWPAVWEDDTRLDWVADVATCQSTAGSFTLSGGDGTSIIAGTYTLYIHPNGSTNPASDGKVYETITRTYCVNVGDNCTIKGVWGRRACYNNGPFNGGTNSYFHGLLGDGSVRHQALAESGEMYHCVGWGEKIDSRTQEIILEFFMPDATGRSGTWRECIAKHVEIQSGTAIANGFGGHTSSASTPYDSYECIDCAIENSSVVGTEVNNTNITRLYSVNGYVAPQPLVATSIVDPYLIYSGNGLNEASGTQGAIVGVVSGSHSASINGLRVYVADPVNGDAGYGSNIINFEQTGASSSVTVENSVIVDESNDNAAVRYQIRLNGAGDHVVNNVVCRCNEGSNKPEVLRTPVFTTGSYAGDNNVYYRVLNPCIWRVNNTRYFDFGSFQTALDPEEASSVFSDPSVADPANGNFHLNGSGLPATAGITRHNVHKSYMKDIPATLASAETWVVNRLLGLSDDALIDGVTRSVTRTLTRGVTEGWSWGA